MAIYNDNFKYHRNDTNTGNFLCKLSSCTHPLTQAINDAAISELYMSSQYSAAFMIAKTLFDNAEQQMSTNQKS